MEQIYSHICELSTIIIINMTKNTSERLKTLLNGRKIHPWGTKIGLSKTVISRLKQGIFPSTDKLRPVVRAENASINWLLDGVGQPFMVNYCDSDDDFLITLNEFYEEEWKTHVLVDGISLTVVLTQPGSYSVDDVSYLYTIVEVLVGPMGDKTLRLIANKATDTNTFFVETSTTDMRYLYKGQTGTFGLLHAADALLNKSQPLIKTGVQSFISTNKIADTRTPYGESKVSSEEMATIEDLRQLDSNNLAQIRAVIHSLANKSDDSKTKK